MKYTTMLREFVGETSEPKLVPESPLLGFLFGWSYFNHKKIMLNATSQEVAESPPPPIRYKPQKHIFLTEDNEVQKIEIKPKAI